MNDSGPSPVSPREYMERFLRDGDEDSLVRFLEIESDQGDSCEHSYPTRHRIQDVIFRGASYRLSRCVACGERLFLERVDAAIDTPGVPLWVTGDALKQWVQDPDEPAIDSEEHWRIFMLRCSGIAGLTELEHLAKAAVDSKTRSAALYALCELSELGIDKRRVRDVLTSCLHDPEATVRATAMECLSHVADHKAIPDQTLLDALRTGNLDVRVTAADDVAKHGTSDPRIIASLQACLDDNSELLRHCASRALWRVTKHPADVVPVCVQALAALADAGEDSILMAARKEQYAEAIEMLIEMGSEAYPATESLEQISRFMDPELSELAQRALRSVERR